LLLYYFTLANQNRISTIILSKIKPAVIEDLKTRKNPPMTNIVCMIRLIIRKMEE